MTLQRRPVRSVVAIAIAASFAVVGCSSDGEDDLFDDGDPSTPVDQGSVVPDEGGLEPVDNVDEDVNRGGIGNPQEDVDNNQPSQQDG